MCIRSLSGRVPQDRDRQLDVPRHIAATRRDRDAGGTLRLACFPLAAGSLSTVIANHVEQ
jgi:hypothetical protein